jgi:hypothetical protein
MPPLLNHAHTDSGSMLLPFVLDAPMCLQTDLRWLRRGIESNHRETPDDAKAQKGEMIPEENPDPRGKPTDGTLRKRNMLVTDSGKEVNCLPSKVALVECRRRCALVRCGGHWVRLTSTRLRIFKCQALPIDIQSAQQPPRNPACPSRTPWKADQLPCQGHGLSLSSQTGVILENAGLGDRRQSRSILWRERLEKT